MILASNGIIASQIALGPVATAATGIGMTSFTANWNAYSGAQYYLLDVSTSSSFSTFVYQDQVVLAPTTSYVVIGLTENTTYYYRLRASTDPALLLDAYPSAAAAYSLRKLRTAYTGSAIRVRRSSDNTETDIGFSSGNLDTSALTTFCSGTNGFVTTWYDQSGNGNNATQTTAANQPRIVNAGVVYLKNTKPEILFDTKYLTIASSTNYFNNFTFAKNAGFAICHRDDSTGYKAVIGSNNGIGSSIGFQMATSPSYALNDYNTNGNGEISFNQTSNNVITTNTLFLYSILWDLQNSTAADRSLIYVNNGTAIKNNIRTGTSTNANASYDLSIGSVLPSGNGIFNGGISEIILYASDQTTNRIGISTNINTYYAIY